MDAMCDRCIRTYLLTYIHTYIHTCTYTDTYIYIYICSCLYLYIHTYIHTYNIQTYIHTYIHTYKHTYMQTCTYASKSILHGIWDEERHEALLKMMYSNHSYTLLQPSKLPSCNSENYEGRKWWNCPKLEWHDRP